MVYVDKVQVAQKQADETKLLLQRNVNQMIDNIEDVEQKLLPTVLKLEEESKDAKQIALEIEKDARRRRRQSRFA